MIVLILILINIVILVIRLSEQVVGGVAGQGQGAGQHLLHDCVVGDEGAQGVPLLLQTLKLELSRCSFHNKIVRYSGVFRVGSGYLDRQGITAWVGVTVSYDEATNLLLTEKL